MYRFLNLALFVGFLCSFKVEARPLADDKIVTASVLLNEKNAPNFNAIIAALRTQWQLKVDSVTVADRTAIFSTPEATVMLAYLDYPTPKTDLEPAAAISWLWKTADKETAGHRAQVVISIAGSSRRALALYKLFTKVGATVLEKTDASGIFLSAQYLVVSKGYFMESAKNMQDNALPVYCWVYFGLLQQQGKTSCYTYGMQELGMPEVEVVRSEQPIAQTHAVVFDAVQYMLQYNITPTDGRALPIGDGQKIKTVYSEGVALKDAKTVKLEF